MSTLPLKHKFSASEEVAIIDFYRDHEHTKDSNYSNKHMRKSAMEKLSSQLGEVPEDQIKSKWCNLRTQYVRESKTAKGKSGASVEDVQVNWIHFKSLDFLRKGQDAAANTTNIAHLLQPAGALVEVETYPPESESLVEENTSVSSLSPPNTESYLSDEVNTEELPKKKKRKSKEISTVTDDSRSKEVNGFLSSASRYLEQHIQNNSIDDQASDFCRGLVHRLRKLSSDQLEDVIFQINSIVYQAIRSSQGNPLFVHINDQ